MKEEKTGDITLTYRLRFYDKHLDWLWQTKVLYNKVVEYYYRLLGEHLELLDFGSYALMRELEVMTIGTKEMKRNGQTVLYPLQGFPSIPLYFRRAAINCAIGLVHSFQVQRQEAGVLLKGQDFISSGIPLFSVSPVYYKGMYKEITENSIQLKVFTGEKWVWNCYRFSGRPLPKDAVLLSPVICIEKKQAYLHVPVKKTVKDIRTMKEKMRTEKRILAVSFPGSDSIAVAAVMTREGEFEKAIFFHGGLQMKAKKSKWKSQLKKVKKMQIKDDTNGEKKAAGERYRRKIQNINEYYAHLISRRILDYCIEQQIGVIAVPNYRRAIDFSKKHYLGTDAYEWIGRRIIRFLKYKAFSEGILVSAVPIRHISDCCNECGAEIRRYNEGHIPSKNYFGGQLFICPNGHRGNSGLNTAKNVGKRLLSYYQQLQEEEISRGIEEC